MQCSECATPIVIAARGRLGDIVTAESIFRKAHEFEPERKMIFLTLPEYADIMRFCPYISEIRTVKNKAEINAALNDYPEGTRIIRINLGGGSEHNDAEERTAFDLTPSLLQTFQRENALPLKDEPARFYIDPSARVPDGLPAKYLVFHCVSGGKSRLWSPDKWRSLAEYCIGRGIGVVEIGFGSTLNLNNPLYVPACGKNLHVVARIMEGAMAVVGVESGMLHIANALNVFGFVITGRFGKYEDYNFYCGNYRSGIRCNFLRQFGRPVVALPFEPVKYAVKHFLDGAPLSSQECEIYCLKYQVNSFLHNPFLRMVFACLHPFERLRQTIFFHKRPRRPE